MRSLADELKTTQRLFQRREEEIIDQYERRIKLCLSTIRKSGIPITGVKISRTANQLSLEPWLYLDDGEHKMTVKNPDGHTFDLPLCQFTFVENGHWTPVTRDDKWISAAKRLKQILSTIASLCAEEWCIMVSPPKKVKHA